MDSTDSFYINKDEPLKSCFLAMREIVLSHDDGISETLKYGSPCFIYRGKAFCYLWKDKKSQEPYFLMVEGRYLQHPGLETGDRKRMKIFRVDPNKDLPLKSIRALLDEALDLYKSGRI
jgi:hypothetical protein